MIDRSVAESDMITSSKKGAIGIITLDRPDRRNALGTELIRALRDALQSFDRDRKIRAIVITGSHPAFCAGSDLKELAPLPISARCEHEAETAAVVRAIASLSKPVIAAVEGYALGGGFMLAIACDVVVSGSRARWHLPEASNGWLPIWGMRALISRVGPIRARQLSWGAKAIDGSEAYSLGIVDLVANDGDAMAMALQVAESLAALPPEAVASVKSYFYPFAMPDAEHLDHAACEAFARDCASPAAKATFRRFL